MATPRSAARIALGRALRELRTEHGISQEQLALASGVQRKTVHEIEAAKVGVHYETLRKLMGALDESIVELVRRAQEWERAGDDEESASVGGSTGRG